MIILCMRYITIREDAREAMMDGFLACFRNIGRFNYQGEGSLKAWLKKIMVNECLMRLRKQTIIWEELDEVKHEGYSEYGEKVLDAINVKEIIGMVQELPDGCRTIFNLYVFENKNHREIAELLEISESTSKSQLHRARALLKERLYKPAKSIL
jgi:RNA polymerase sigma-70 factor, ECF subfamily